MSTPTYGIHNFKNREVLLEIISELSQRDDVYSEPGAVDAVLASANTTAVFWLTFIRSSVYTIDYDHPGRANEEFRAGVFREMFAFELLRWVIVHADTYINADVERFVELAYPRLGLLRAVGLVSWQAYMQKMDAALQLRIFDQLNAPPAPFEDPRFTVVPVHTECYQKGLVHSPWLKAVEGHLQYVWDDKKGCRTLDKGEHAGRYFYLDAKVGFLFLFEGRPSISVSFNIDKHGSVFVHQVQAKIKDRGHYKLGEHWRTRVTDYIKSVFPHSHVYLIDGQQAANDTYRSYGASAPEGIKPTPSEMARIAQTYNDWEGLSARRRQKSGKWFRKIA